MRSLLFLLVLVLHSLMGQTTGNQDRRWQLPGSLLLKEDGPQAYRFVCDYYNLDTKGRLIARWRISGRYTRGLPEGKVRWSDVRVAAGKEWSDQFGAPQKRDFMEGFSYHAAEAKDMAKPEFFRGFPPMAMQERTLVWDTHMLESFAWEHFGKLSLNTPLAVDPGPMPLAGAGTFHSREVRLMWKGLGRRNGQECALIDYQSFFNTFEMKFLGMDMIGRSHYWGEIWVSLATKQIEYATLFDEVLGELTLTSRAGTQTMNVFRNGVFEKERE